MKDRSYILVELQKRTTFYIDDLLSVTTFGCGTERRIILKEDGSEDDIGIEMAKDDIIKLIDFLLYVGFITEEDIV